MDIGPGEVTIVSKEKKKRKSPERTGPVLRREMTEVRDAVGAVRTLAYNASNGSEVDTEICNMLDVLYTRLDRMDLRFKMHHDGEKKSKGER